MKYSAAFAALAAVSSAASVTLKTTECIQDIPLEEFTIDTNKLVVHELKTVCGLKIVSATGVDASTLVCQAYKDAAGTQLGSAKFTLSSPALIATNPVQEAAVRCDSNSTAIISNPNNGTIGTVTSVTFITLPTGTAGTTAGTGIPSTAPSASGNGNSTVPSATGTPTQPSVAPPAETSSGASLTSLSVGAVVAGLFALFL